MKKYIVAVLLLVVAAGALTPALAVNDQRGGFMGFISGCCFGIRAGAAYNDGKSVHWREWCRLIPYAGVIFAVWDGVDGYKGVSVSDYAARYGASYY
jgi:hypothetical protein